MGKAKALLEWNHSLTFLEKIIGEYRKAGCPRIICMLNEKTEALCRNMHLPAEAVLLINHHPEWGRFYSIKTGLAEVNDSSYCFIQNVDNPFVSVDLIEKLYNERNPDAWCSPVYMGKGGHPVLLPQLIIREILQSDHLNTTLRDVLQSKKRINIAVESDDVLININTPEEYSRYRKF